MQISRQIKFSADELVHTLLSLAPDRNVCLLDSCGQVFNKSSLLIAGFDPVEFIEISNKNVDETLLIFEDALANKLGCIATFSYDFGAKFEINALRYQTRSEPDISLALFETLIFHDYETNLSYVLGFDEKKIDKVIAELQFNAINDSFHRNIVREKAKIISNFSRQTYCEAVAKIKEHIVAGDVYQVNLTQQFSARLPDNSDPAEIFLNLRNRNKVSFASFIRRASDVVISSSPERFLKVCKHQNTETQTIEASPIKGTRRRGKTMIEDLELCNELQNSEKDRAENIMIVDLLRNDLGRICEYGSVVVTNLCEIETNPTVFHLVSTIRGNLLKQTSVSEILKATFPCGSITGAPKIRAMQIINELETVPRGLSMGAIGYFLPDSKLNLPSLDLNVAIRTMVVKDNKAVFNVGGGIVIDSVADDEYEESLTKAKALFQAINGEM